MEETEEEEEKMEEEKGGREGKERGGREEVKEILVQNKSKIQQTPNYEALCPVCIWVPGPPSSVACSTCASLSGQLYLADTPVFFSES